jgi:hypothetical protein
MGGNCGESYYDTSIDKEEEEEIYVDFTSLGNVHENFIEASVITEMRSLRIYVWIHIYIHIYIYICMHIYIYIYIYI